MNEATTSLTRAGFDLKRKYFVHLWAAIGLLKGFNVNEDLVATLRRLDKAEATFIVPAF